ncbi:amidohydrolase family protein [Mycobacteroides chelonae]
MVSKIILEEHVSTPRNNELWDSVGESTRNGADYMSLVEADLLDVDRRVATLKKYDVGYSIISLTSPGIQGIEDGALATEVAIDANDYVKTNYVDKHPESLGFFAAVALQQPEGAAAELRRAVKELGAHGALINGYYNVAGHDGGVYLDSEDALPFWQEVAELGVPIYLHPREARPSVQSLYEPYTSLVGSAWGFAHETATHALRLIMSGLFDRFPDIQIILGHQAEGLPLMIPRVAHRLRKQRQGSGLGNNKQPVEEYFHNNFYATTAGHFHTKSLYNTMLELGTDRTLFSIDYPYEDIEEGATWFDNALLAENDRIKIGRTNAIRLFGLRDDIGKTGA